MKLATHDVPVNPGETEPERLVDASIPMPAWLFEAIRVDAVKGHASIDEVIVRILKEHFLGPQRLPMFLDARTVRYVRECCGLAGVDPDEWVEGWIGQMVRHSLDGEFDVTLTGLCQDLVDEHGTRTNDENADLYETFREVAFRYQREVAAEKSQREASASVEGGEA